MSKSVGGMPSPKLWFEITEFNNPIIVLNDGETWAHLEGCKLLFCDDEFLHMEESDIDGAIKNNVSDLFSTIEFEGPADGMLIAAAEEMRDMLKDVDRYLAEGRLSDQSDIGYVRSKIHEVLGWAEGEEHAS